MQRFLVACFAVALICVVGVSAVTRDVSFATVESEKGQKVVAFCKGENCDEVQQLLEAVSDFGSAFEYVRVVCDAEENEEKCTSSGLGAITPIVFLNSAEAGIEKYSGDLNADSLKDFLKFRSEPIADDKVVQFESAEQIEKLRKEGNHIFAKFFQHWCGHCKNMKKHMQKSSLEFSPEEKIVHLDVDCGAAHASEYCQQHQVRGYPTIKLLKPDGTEDAYNGGRSFAEITSYLKPFAASGSGSASATETETAAGNAHEEL